MSNTCSHWAANADLHMQGCHQPGEDWRQIYKDSLQTSSFLKFWLSKGLTSCLVLADWGYWLLKQELELLNVWPKKLPDVECGFQIQCTHWGAVYSNNTVLSLLIWWEMRTVTDICVPVVSLQSQRIPVSGAQACDVSTREDETGGIMRIIKTMIINGFERQHGDACL